MVKNHSPVHKWLGRLLFMGRKNKWSMSAISLSCFRRSPCEGYQCWHRAALSEKKRQSLCVCFLMLSLLYDDFSQQHFRFTYFTGQKCLLQREDIKSCVSSSLCSNKHQCLALTGALVGKVFGCFFYFFLYKTDSTSRKRKKKTDKLNPLYAGDLIHLCTRVLWECTCSMYIWQNFDYYSLWLVDLKMLCLIQNS